MNSWAKTSKQGFTIVELLIVIVVIGILASITLVAYNGIQNRAHDAAVRGDLVNLSKKIQLYNAEFGTYPLAGSETTGSTTFTDIKFSPTKKSYSTSSYNLYYCRDSTAGSNRFAVGAASKSGNIFQVTSDDGPGDFTGTWGSSGTNCPGMGITPFVYSYGYHVVNAVWNSWINP